MTIVEFLMQRIAEDEAVARAATPGATALLALIVSQSGYQGYEDRVHNTRYRPARVLAECAAKRRIVELHQPDDDRCSVCSHEIGYTSDGYGGEYYENYRTGNDWPCATLRALAAVYSDHPDYRQEWGTLWENPPQGGSAEMADPLNRAPKGQDMRWQQPPRTCEHNGDRIELRQLCSANPETICIDCGRLIVTDQPTLAARADAAPVEPRTLPTEAEVAEALIQYETSGMCHYGRTCALCDCARSWHPAEKLPELDSMELDRARAALALFAAQPTVAQAKAEAWDEGREALAAEFLQPLPASGMRAATRNPYRESEG